MEIALFRPKLTGPIALLIGAVLFFFGALYFGGVINVLGYEHRSVTFSGFASGTKAGGGFGLKDMLFFKGQTFYADYDVTIREGSFRISVFDLFAPIGEKPHFGERVTESGSGEATYVIPETGIYTMIFEGSVLGGKKGAGYDVTYDVTWGVR